MQTIKLVLPGSYYDSQIYAGRLYLWCEDGSLLVLNWDKLVDRVISKVGDHLKFATHCGLRKGSYLYGNEWRLFALDNEMRGLLLARFAELAQSPIELSTDDVNYARVQQQNNPFVFPHADILIYYSQFYVGSSAGLQVSKEISDLELLNHSPTKIWDGPTLSLAASYHNIAVAAGTEGLYESNISLLDTKPVNFRQRDSRSSKFVRWLYPSIFSSSYSGGYLANYAIEKFAEQNNKEQKTEKRRVFRETFTDNELFDGETKSKTKRAYSWGVRDKICLAWSNSIQIIRYVPETPSKRKSEDHFIQLGRIDYDYELGSEIIGADSAYFGYILETDEGILIFNSNFESTWLQGEPVNWRVFPDTVDYINHLHVIYDDHLDILSFTQDYFVEQYKKKVGISFGARY